ncbi:MAG: family 10 glycosylhydrolase [Vitreoscilla sp.]|nr:family 10 glycosylhydrolase [Vitreoscilla sp.]
MRLTLWWPLALLLFACGGSGGATEAVAPKGQPFSIELIVRTAENFHSTDDVARFVAQAAAHQVVVINLLVKQDEDAAIPSGAVYYRSALAPAAAGYETFDVLQTMLDAAHAKGLRVRAWMPQFHDQVAATAHPAWQMMAKVGGTAQPYTGSRQTEYFVNPLSPEVQAYELALIREVLDHYAVDGLMLDWIRFDNHNMDVGPGTRQAYQAATGIDPLTLDFTQPSAALERWNAFRTEGLAAYVKQVRQALPPGRDMGVYILPPEFVEVGQDAARFNDQTDLLSPMCYFRDWGFPVAWVWQSCMATTVQKAGAAAVVPAMDMGLSDAQYSQIMGRLRSDFAGIRTLAWFHHGTWSEAQIRQVAQLSQP